MGVGFARIAMHARTVALSRKIGNCFSVGSPKVETRQTTEVMIMWVWKTQYEHLCADNASLRRDSNVLKSILSAIDNAEDGRIFIGEVVIMSSGTLNDIQAQWQADKDAVMRLTAERDWYKQKYAELIVSTDTKGWFYDEQRGDASVPQTVQQIL